MHQGLTRLRKLSRLILLAPILALLGAGSGNPVVSLPQNLAVVAGSSVNIPVTIDTDGAGIVSFQVGFDLGPCLTYRQSPGVSFISAQRLEPKHQL